MAWRSWVVPPVLSAWASQRSGHLTRFDDSVHNWAQAEGKSSGYDSGLILDQVVQATQKVIREEAVFERDGVIFSSPEYRWPVLSGLLGVAARERELRVLDFGGSLGSVFWQHRKFFSGIDITWGVVEQPSFVAAGQALDQDFISFFDSIDSCLQAFSPNVILLSSVLQYLPEPDHVITELLNTTANTVIIDRTPLSESDNNVACLQIVPAHIYSGNYPAWVFSRTWLTTQLEQFKKFEVAAWFDGIEPTGRTSSGLAFEWDGLIAHRKNND